jgi:hypothetical protein
MYLGPSDVLLMMMGKPCILRSLLPLEKEGRQERFASTFVWQSLGIAYIPFLVSGVAKMAGVAR